MAPTDVVVKRKIEWIIKNVTKEKVKASGYRVESTTFVINLPHIQTKWKVQSYHVNSQLDKISLYLSFVNYKESATGLNVKFSIAKPPMNFSRQWCKQWPALGWRSFLDVDELFDPTLKYVDDVMNWKLEFKLELTYSYANVDASFGSNYFNDTELADFVLTSSDGEDIKVHSLILAHHSKYFKKMLTIDMKEKRSKSVSYRDIDSATLKEVLKFIYMGKFEATDIEVIKDVLYAAEKLEIYGLIVLCCAELIKEVKIENALELLDTAVRVRSEELEEKCLEIIMNNYNEFEQDIDEEQSKKINRAFATARGVPHFTFRSVL